MKLSIRLTVCLLVITMLVLPVACSGTPEELPPAPAPPAPAPEPKPEAPAPEPEPQPEPDFQTIEADLLGQTVTFNIGENTAIWQDVEVKSADGKITYQMPWGTMLADADGKAITSLSATLGDTPSQPAEGKLLGPTITFTPTAITIDPGATLSCDVSDYLGELGDVPEKDLCFARYETASGNWTKLPCSVDTMNHLVTIFLTEFTDDSTFGLYALKEAEPEVTEPPQAIPLEWISITPPTSKPGDEITVVVRTTPGAICNLTFINPPYNPSLPRTRSAQKPPVQTADGNGVATFVWRTSTHAHAGDADLEVVLTLGEDTATYLHPYTLRK